MRGELVARQYGEAENVLRTGALLLVEPDGVEPGEGLGHHAQVAVLAVQGQGHHVAGTRAVVVEELILLGEAVHVVEVQAVLVIQLVADGGAEGGVVLAVEGGLHPHALVQAVEPDTGLPTEGGLAVGILEAHTPGLLGLQLVDQQGALEGQDVRAARAVLAHEGGLELTERERHGVDLHLGVQLIELRAARGAVPAAVGVGIAGVQAAHVPVGQQLDVVEDLGLVAQTEAAPLIVAAAAVAVGAALHAVTAAGGVQRADLVLSPQVQLHLLHVGVEHVVALRAHQHQAFGCPLAEAQAVDLRLRCRGCRLLCRRGCRLLLCSGRRAHQHGRRHQCHDFSSHGLLVFQHCPKQRCIYGLPHFSANRKFSMVSIPPPSSWHFRHTPPQHGTWRLHTEVVAGCEHGPTAE